MTNESNALAELADWLECQEDCFPVLANQFSWQDKQDIENIKKIRRIIAELAKVETATDLVGLIGKCHAIAEEGVNHGER